MYDDHFLFRNSGTSALPWKITFSAMGACLSLILIAVEVAAAEVSANHSNLMALADELALTDQQAIQVDQILAQAMKSRKSIKDAPDKDSRENERATLKSITEDADRQLKAVLTDEQFAKYIALRKKIRREALRQRARESWRRN